MTNLQALPPFRLGVCYYPEHWPESMWDDDFSRMKELGFSIVRMAEFAWAIFEPEEGVFDFSLFDRALDSAHRHGLQVILGTPTATPPAWLTQTYPESLNVTLEGVTLQHGMRQHTNHTSPIFLELCARITLKLAEHYKDHPALAGWQLDNELNCEMAVFYSESDHQAFRLWLQKKYETLDRLNEAWGTVFWSQTYSDWSQVHLSRPTASPKQPNPHLALDEKRFISDSTIAFAKRQADIIREICPHHWITTNGLFGHLDSHRLTDELLDFFSYDSYPQFSSIFYDEKEEAPLYDRNWSLTLTAVRSISSNFGVMEQQSGPGGWVNRMDMPSPRPGQMRLWTYQSIAHGADMVLYFRWRTATVGNEIYWHGINDYHNKPNRRVREAGQIGGELARIGDFIAGTRNQASIALVRDYDNEWDGEYDVWHGPFSWQSGKAWFKAMQRRHIPNDILYLRESNELADLLAYKILIYPHPAILREETAALLEEYVRAGGTLIFGCRTGYKDERGHCYMLPFPGTAASLTGISVDDFTRIKGTRKPVDMRWHPTVPDANGASKPSLAEGQAEDVAAILTRADEFNEILQVEADEVTVEAVYASDYYAGKPAVTRRRVGLGEVWYFGAVFNPESAGHLLDRLHAESPTEEWLRLPAAVELTLRSGNSGTYAFVLNFGDEPAAITVLTPKVDLLSGSTIHGEYKLAPYDVLILMA
ncbi:beta-galactosidase [Gorillibacterium timonense]|uniref:beta-galactosidase n=1 Tax=Gorillibacterium timonense TaxID=1689269 RepID=UPI00071DCCF3|nr:beta-galactosidase [Gorillibacterium timonense]